MGVSPWRTNLTHGVSPEGTTGNDSQTIHVAPSGLLDLVAHIHGLTPVATTYRPFGTNVFSPATKHCAILTLVRNARPLRLV